VDRFDRAVDRVENRLIWIVLVLGVLGVAAPGPARGTADAGGIELALILLVAAVGLGVRPDALLPPRRLLVRCVVALLVGAVVLPVLAYLAGRFVASPALRGGVLAAGLAPAEVASVAIVAMAGGRTSVATTILVGSTVTSVLIAGPVLAMLAPGASADPIRVLAGLVLIVALPLAVAVGIRTLVPHAPWDRVSRAGSVLMVLVLVWLVAGQIPVSAEYVQVVLPLLAFVAMSTAVGWVLGAGLGPADRLSVALPTGMRDFAIAAGIAVQAFGARSAAPLGLYGLMVLVLGAFAAARRRRR
jgi:predicted Na+-dependent transporter